MFALCRLLLGIARRIVPASHRADWTREWQAEVFYRLESARETGRGAGPDLVARCAGALVHAAWLRKEDWSVSVLTQDLRYALRNLSSRPGFAIVSILVLALGLGANATVFSVVDGVLLEPLPYRSPERLVQIWETNPSMNWTQATVAPANLLDWRARNRTFEDMAYALGADGKNPRLNDATLTGGGEPERVRAMTVSGNFFDVLGAGPRLGRVLQPADATPGGPKVVVLSDAFWRRRFAGDPSVIGRRIDIDGISTEIAGVMPPAFHVPGVTPDFWEAHQMSEAGQRRMRRAHWFRVVGRLKPGVTLEDARADMTRIASELEREYPSTNTEMGVGLGPLHDWYVGDVRRAVALLMGAVTLVLLITCTNVASLLLARATARRREIAIRVALGASRLRLIRQLLTESFVLASIAGALGIALAWLALDVVRAAGPADVPRLTEVGLDGSVFGFVAAVVCATTLVFGLAPAWQSARAPAVDSLKEGLRSTGGDGAALRRALIVGEVALSVVLLAGAGVLLRSFVRLQAVDPGVAVSEAVTFRVTLPNRYDSDPKISGFYSEAADRLRTLPGVQGAGASVRLALQGHSWTGDLFIEGQPDVRGRDLRHKSVTPGYLDAAGMRLMLGRDFTPADTIAGPPVAIVNRTLAARFFGNANPVGRRIAFARPNDATVWTTIVGVVADEKQDALDAAVQPEVLVPHTQDARSDMAFVVRTAADPAALLPSIRAVIADLDPAVAIFDVQTMEQVVRASLAEERLSAQMLGGFAVVAVALAAIGLYGLVAFTVSQRTREIGLRIALGADRPAVLWMVIWAGLRLVVYGVAAGLVAAGLVARALEAFLYETPSRDPLVFGLVALTLLGAGLLASSMPAWRASRVDPAVSLRAE